MIQLIDQIKQDQIAGHEAAIAAYTTVIGDLMPLQRDKFVDTLINQYLETKSEQDRKKKALHFVGIWRASHLNQTRDKLL